MEEKISRLEKCIGYEFKDKGLAREALTHSSYVNELTIKKFKHYERLEFLGDAVLELAVSEFLYENFPEKREGEMTGIRASLVCERTLAECSRNIGIPDLLILGKGEAQKGGAQRDSILCDVFEAVAAALYLDAGYKKAREYIERFLLTDWEDKVMFVDSKSLLQVKLQKEKKKISYENIKKDGPSDSPLYTEGLFIDGKIVEEATAHSRKEAQQKAAYEYLLKHR